MGEARKAQPAGIKSCLGCLVVLVAIGAVIGVIEGHSSGGKGGGMSANHQSPGPPVIVQGADGGDSTTFQLAGGGYHVDIEANGSCFYSYTLERADGSYNHDVGPTLGMFGPKRDHDDIDGVPAGAFIVSVNSGDSGCPYVLTFTTR